MTSIQEKLTRNQKLIAVAGFAAERGVSEAISDLLDGSINDSDAGESATDPAWSETIIPKTDWDPTFLVSSKGYDFQYTVKHRLIAGAVALNSDNKPYYQIASSGTSGQAGILLDVVVSLTYSSYFKTGLVGCYGVNYLSNSISDSYSSSGQPSTGDKGGISTVSMLDSDDDGVADAANVAGNILINSGAQIKGPTKATGKLTLSTTSSILKDAYANGDISIGSDGWIGDDAWSNGSINGSGDVNGTPHPNQVNPVVELEECDPIGLTGALGVFVTGEHQDAQNGTIRHLPTLTRNDNADLNSSATTGFNGSYDYSYTLHSAPTDIIGIAGSTRKYYFTNFSIDVPSGSTPVQTEIRGDVTMFIDGDFSLKNTSRMELAANSTLTIYLAGTFLMQSNTELNSGGITSKLRIYSTAENSTDNLVGAGNEDPKVKILSNSGFSGAIYAPYAHVVSNSNSDIYGAIRGKWVTMEQNEGFHYDEDLQNLGEGSPNGFKQVYWSQQSFTSSGTP